jgi:Bacterial aa3 type cytochrome c oxidase subunit IV
MAEHNAEPAGHPDMDYAEHERTYEMFVRLLKYSAIGVIGLLAMLAYLWG